MIDSRSIRNLSWRHDDVIKWNHFPRYWPFVREIHRFPVNSPHKGQWRGALMFALICVWINGWVVNNREAGDLRRHRAHYDVIVMVVIPCLQRLINTAISVPLTIKNVWKLKHKVLYIPGTTMLKMHAVVHVSDGAAGAVRFLVVGTIGKKERPPRGQLWMEQYLPSL